MKALRPTCATCGKPLAKSEYCITSDGRHFDPQHGLYDLELKKYVKTDGFTADAMPATRGRYGDNLVCSQACGHLLAVRLVLAIPGILDLLPDKWLRSTLATQARDKRLLRERSVRAAAKERRKFLAPTVFSQQRFPKVANS